MAIELEMPAELESANWTASSETATASEIAADQAVGLLEAEVEPEALNEGREIEGVDGETISITAETTSQESETTIQDGETEDPQVVTEMEPVTAAQEIKPSPQEIAQLAWKLRIREISDELAEAALERLEAESRYKAAKNREKAIVEQLSEVMKEGPRVMPLFDRQPDQQSSVHGVAVAESVAPDAQTWAESTQPVVIEPLTDDAWRSVRLSELRLKPKLQERLEEAGVDTIGRLEDLRAEISQGREKWPKGIGKAKITEIEDAVIAWLSKNRDAQVLADAQAQVHAQAQAETIQDESAEPLANVEEAEFDPCARAVELDDLANPADLTNLDPKHPDGAGYWQSGVDAYNQDAKVSECPYVAGPEADDWIRGWLSAGKDESFMQEQDDQEDRGEVDKPAGNGAGVSLDDL